MSAVEFPTVQGCCPMGCGETLFLAAGGHITCARLHCPRPTAADEVLADRETEHIVKFGPGTFTVRHPLRERLDDELMACELHDHIAGLDGPPVQPGQYRATQVSNYGERWHWEPLPPP